MCQIKRCFNEHPFIGTKVCFFLKHAKYFQIKDSPAILKASISYWFIANSVIHKKTISLPFNKIRMWMK